MIRKVKVKDIRPNQFQNRKNMDAESIKSLADEIDKVGLWAGALRGREKNGHIELCFGHRRLEAVKVLGWKEVDVDVVELSDEEMALQCLIENLQREGINDADRGDGIAAYIKVKTGVSDLSALYGSGGKNRVESKDERSSLLSAKEEIGQLLGISSSRIKELLQIAGWNESLKEPIRQQKISGHTAVTAERMGGPEAVKVVAEKKLGSTTMAAIQSEFNALPDETEQDKKVKEKVRQRFIKGEINSADEVVTKARQIKGQATRKESVPPDLVDYMRGMTERAHRWAKELQEVAPYIDYIDSEPIVAKRWRDAVKTLIETLEKFS